MRVLGVDFTSSPSRKKPITVAVCKLDDTCLQVRRIESITTFVGFEHLLWKRGPWIAGLDFPFGLPRRFLEDNGWPLEWAEYVTRTAQGGKEAFIDELTRYRKSHPEGQREHRRKTDERANSISPQKLFGVPLARMFYQGAPRLLHANVHAPPIHSTDDTRITVEAYPGVLVRGQFGKISYKNDQKDKQTVVQRKARMQIVSELDRDWICLRYGVKVLTDDSVRQSMIDDAGGDILDAVLAAIQAAWAFTNRDRNYGIPDWADASEGWIVDPNCLEEVLESS